MQIAGVSVAFRRTDQFFGSRNGIVVVRREKEKTIFFLRLAPQEAFVRLVVQNGQNGKMVGPSKTIQGVATCSPDSVQLRVDSYIAYSELSSKTREALSRVVGTELSFPSIASWWPDTIKVLMEQGG